MRLLARLAAGTVLSVTGLAMTDCGPAPQHREPLAGVPGTPFSDGGSWLYTYVTATEPFDFMDRHWDYGATTFDSITARIEVGELTDRGITNLMVYGPYASTGQWRGLPATGDLMDFDPANGTLDDWRELVSAANERGITVTIYVALLYLHESSPLFQQAERDRAAGVDSWQSRLLRWDEREPDGEPAPESPPSESDVARPPQGDWAFSEVAQWWYATSWGHPALDYASTATMDFAERVLAFWMDQGVQGFEIDAPQTMWGFQDGGPGGVGEQRHAELLAFARQYRPEWQLYLHAEGFGTYEQVAAMDRLGYSHLMVNLDADDDSLVLQVARGDLGIDQLEAHYASFLDHRRRTGRGTYATAIYSPELPPSLRGFDLAVQAGSGVTVSLDQQLVLDGLPAGEVDDLLAVYAALAASPAEAPGADRERLPASPADTAYAVLRTSANGARAALNVFNFSPEPVTITVDLGSVDTTRSTSVDLLTGAAGPEMVDGRLEVTLPGYGWQFLDLGIAPADPPTVIDSADPGWSTGGGWAVVEDASALGGSRLGGTEVGGFGEIVFSGTSVAGYGPVSPNGTDRVEVFVDGQSRGIHSQTAAYLREGAPLFVVEGLPAGEHTLRIVQLDGERGFSSVDYLLVR